MLRAPVLMREQFAEFSVVDDGMTPRTFNEVVGFAFGGRAADDFPLRTQPAHLLA